jgi:hypothetical protein
MNALQIAIGLALSVGLFMVGWVSDKGLDRPAVRIAAGIGLFIAAFVATYSGHLEWFGLLLIPAFLGWMASAARQLVRKGRPAGWGPVVVGIVLLALATGGVAYGILHIRQLLGWSLVYIAIAFLSLWAAGWLLRKGDGLAHMRNSGPLDEAALLRQIQFTALGLLALVFGAASLTAIASLQIASLLLGLVAAWILVWIPRRIRTRRSHGEFQVRCSPSRAFEFVSDRRNVPRYVDEVESSELLTSLPIGVGSRFRERVRTPEVKDQLFGTIPSGVMEGEEQIVAFDPPTRLGLEIIGSRKSGGVWTFAQADGGTTVHFESAFEYALADAWLGVRFHPSTRRTEVILAGLRRRWYERLRELLEEKTKALS